MEIIVSFKHLDVVESVKERAEKKTEKIKKFIKDITNINYTFSKDKLNHILEIVANAKGSQFIATAETSDYNLAIDECVDKIISQVKKHKDKSKSNF